MNELSARCVGSTRFASPSTSTGPPSTSSARPLPAAEAEDADPEGSPGAAPKEAASEDSSGAASEEAGSDGRVEAADSEGACSSAQALMGKSMLHAKTHAKAHTSADAKMREAACVTGAYRGNDAQSMCRFTRIIPSSSARDRFYGHAPIRRTNSASPRRRSG